MLLLAMGDVDYAMALEAYRAHRRAASRPAVDAHATTGLPAAATAPADQSPFSAIFHAYGLDDDFTVFFNFTSMLRRCCHEMLCAIFESYDTGADSESRRRHRHRASLRSPLATGPWHRRLADKMSTSPFHHESSHSTFHTVFAPSSRLASISAPFSYATPPPRFSGFGDAINAPAQLAHDATTSADYRVTCV